MNQLLTGLCDLVYPPHCLICQKHLLHPDPEGILCPNCREGLIRNTPPFCPKCSRHLKNPALARCTQCLKNPRQFDFGWSAFQYTGPIRDLIIRYKYNQKTRLRKLFARCMNDFVNRYSLDIRQFDWVVPIPLHAVRLRERSYNQAQLLAEPIALEYGLPLSVGNLVRARNTKQQNLLSEKERWTNIRGAFRINDSAKFSKKNILIIDDLLTTGATVSEAAGVLKSAGAKTVGVLTLAITA